MEKTRGRFPGWRTMTKAQRYNARMDAIWESARADPNRPLEFLHGKESLSAVCHELKAQGIGPSAEIQEQSTCVD